MRRATPENALAEDARAEPSSLLDPAPSAGQRQPAREDQPARRVLVAIALVAGCTLAFQVLLTRLLSSVLYYHFSFLSISLALLGTGAGAIFVYLLPDWFDHWPLGVTLARLCAGFSALLVIVTALLVRIDYSYPGSVTTTFALRLAAVCVLVALPFLAAGLVIALVMRGYTAMIGTVYAADLGGAAIGAVVVVPLLWIADAPSLIASLGIVAAVATMCFVPAGAAERKVGLLLAGLATIVVALSLGSSILYLPPRLSVPPRARQIADRWTPLSRVVGFAGPEGATLSPVFYDRCFAPVIHYRRGDPLPLWSDLRLGPQSIGYALTGPKRTLIIGGGGGRDILNALSSGQRQVDVVELNQGIRRVVDEDMAALSGSPYSLPGVSTSVGDGRSFLAASVVKYDQIQLSFTDTLSANSASAFALTENNLYTIEAFAEYLGHLAPRGVLNVSRLYKLSGDEALRATILTLEALARHGVEHPERNVVVVRGRDMFDAQFGTILARL